MCEAGDGTEPEHMLVVRLARLDQSEAAVNAWLFVGLVMLTASVVVGCTLRRERKAWRVEERERLERKWLP